jgi:FMN phosphatase YigB (HAD superfamily)
MAKPPGKTVYLFDVDNTLLDNDRVLADLKKHLDEEVGLKDARHYWQIFEKLRNRLGYADYLGALQAYRRDHPSDLRLLRISRFLINYPFANRLLPSSLDVLEHVKKHGAAVLLSDGDVVFQPHKIDCSGLAEAVDGHVLIYVHKERQLDDVRHRYPSAHYVMIDDKLRILTAVKRIWRQRVTTVFVRQGHYAQDPKEVARYPAADVSINRIADLLNHDLSQFARPGRAIPASRKGRKGYGRSLKRVRAPNSV